MVTGHFLIGHILIHTYFHFTFCHKWDFKNKFYYILSNPTIIS